VIGHRGAPGYRPEHTRASYELAIALGADAVEPDLVSTRDCVLVVRHENEISGTTDVAQHPEFADRRATKSIDGVSQTGWFTEDFTWNELATLRAIERLPRLRPHNATFDGTQPMLRLSDLLEIVDDASERMRRPVRMVSEIKHASYFASIGMPLDELVADQLKPWGSRERLTVECFEQTVLAQLAQRGVDADYVYLIESSGAAADLVAREGSAATTYAEQLTDAGLARLARAVDGISVDKSLLLTTGASRGAVGTTDLVARAHEHGLSIFTWTLRPENHFLAPGHRVGPATGPATGAADWGAADWGQANWGQADWGDWRREFELIMSTGVDGVFADHPDLAIAVRDGL
jgi:glycerophosphoryl diester phosphodiesterase